MKKLTISIIILLMQVITSGTASAQQYKVNVHGVSISCTASNGGLVPFYADRNAARAARKMGGARADFRPRYGYTIALDLNFMNSLTPLGAFFAIYHECAHVALPMGVGLGSSAQERNADCHAVRSMRAHGLIRSSNDFNQAMSAVIQSGSGHSIDRRRINAAARCL